MRAINAKRFSQVMRQLARVPSQSSTAIAKEIGAEIQKRMDASQDPYGRAWKRKADGSASKLKRTGRGRASIAVRATAGAGFKITVGVLYMIYHQFGGASHLRGPGKDEDAQYKNRRKHRDFGRDKDRSAGRNRPPKRSFLPLDRMPKAWLDIMEKHLTRASLKVLRG